MSEIIMQRINDKRDYYKMPLRTLSLMSGVNLNRLREWHRKKNCDNASFEEMKRIANVLSIPYTELVYMPDEDFEKLSPL
jgi:hypothetical protein